MLFQICIRDLNEEEKIYTGTKTKRSNRYTTVAKYDIHNNLHKVIHNSIIDEVTF